MALFDRLLGFAEPKIPVHDFMAALGESERGRIALIQIVNAFGLDAGETTELEALVNRVITPPESISLGGLTVLPNVGVAYDSIQAARGLGIVRVRTAGITGFDFTVNVNKIGTGTQSWQLFDETNGVELTVIDDAGAAGNKTITSNVNLVTPWPLGLIQLRVRAKSTVAADDPVFYGACLTLRRFDVMVSETLHEVLLLGESRIVPYASVAAVKTRLGL